MGLRALSGDDPVLALRARVVRRVRTMGTPQRGFTLWPPVRLLESTGGLVSRRSRERPLEVIQSDRSVEVGSLSEWCSRRTEVTIKGYHRESKSTRRLRALSKQWVAERSGHDVR